MLRRAADARDRRRLGFEALDRDRLPATITSSVGAAVQPIERSVQLGKVRTRPSEKGGDLRAFETDGRTFGVVLVVGVRFGRR